MSPDAVTAPAPESGRRGWAAAVALLAAAALGLRLHGIDFLLPHLTDPDAHIVRQAELAWSGAEAPERDANWGKYPHLVMRLVALTPRPAPAGAGDGVEAHLAAAAAPYVRTRLVVAALAVLLVPLTYRLGRLLLGRPAAALAAALVAVSLLHVSFSQQARPHAASATLTLLAVLAAVRLRRRPSAGSALAAGAAAALAIGTLQFGVSALLPLAVAHLLRERRTGSAAGRGRAWLAALGVAAPLALSVPLFHDYLLHPEVEGDEVGVELRGGTLRLGGHVIYLNAFDGTGFGVLARTFASYEPVTLALALVGLVALLAGGARSRGGTGSGRDLVVVLVHAAGFLVVVGLYKRTYERFAITLVPYLACLAALGVERALARVPAERGRRALGAAAAALVLALPAWAAWRLTVLRARPDTLERAAAWLEATAGGAAGAGPITISRHLDLPLVRRRPALLRDGKPLEGGHAFAWARYQSRLGADELPPERYDVHWMERADDALIERRPGAYVRGLGARWAVVEVFEGGRRHLLLERIREGLRGAAELVARFAPEAGGDGPPVPLSYHDSFGHFAAGERRDPNLTLRVLGADACGPPVEVYRFGE